MRLESLLQIYNVFWMMESHAQQRLSWHDAAVARVARVRAEMQAAEQLQAMLAANPSGQLGNAQMDDGDILKAAGLL